MSGLYQSRLICPRFDQIPTGRLTLPSHSGYHNSMDAMTTRRGVGVILRQGRRFFRRWAIALCAMSILGGWQTGAEGRDLLVPKEQVTTEFEPTETPSLDVQQKGVPQSLFTWIKMARGYEVEWDTFGRKGWFTQDPRLKPIAPGTTVFTTDTPAVYIVFEVAPLEDPAQFAAQVFAIGADGKTGDVVIVQDSLEVPGHERYGFLELKKPSPQWLEGRYLVKVYITSLGQQPFHAVNQVGTMRFVVTDQPSSDVLPAVPEPSSR